MYVIFKFEQLYLLNKCLLTINKFNNITIHKEKRSIAAIHINLQWPVNLRPQKEVGSTVTSDNHSEAASNTLRLI